MTRRFPLKPMGGLLVLCVGLGIVAGGLIGRDAWVPALAAGFALAALAQAAYAPRLPRPPTAAEWRALATAAAVDVALIGLVAASVEYTARPFWLWVLLAVGAHFLPMGYAVGPPMAALGVLCMACAGVGLCLPDVPAGWFWVADGSLKVVLGGLMLPRRPAGRRGRSGRTADPGRRGWVAGARPAGPRSGSELARRSDFASNAPRHVKPPNLCSLQIQVSREGHLTRRIYCQPLDSCPV